MYRMSRRIVSVLMLAIAGGLCASARAEGPAIAGHGASSARAGASEIMVAHGVDIDAGIHERITRAIGTDRFEFQMLSIEPSDGGNVWVDLQLDNTSVTLALWPYSIRSSDFRVVSHVADGETSKTVPSPSRTYRGAVEGRVGTRVAATIDAGHVNGLIRHSDGRLWRVQAIADILHDVTAPGHVVFAADESLESFGECGVETPENPAPVGGMPRGVMTSCDPIVAKIALVADFEYYQYQGSSVPATTQAIETIVNAMAYIYEEELGITYQLTQIDVWTGGNLVNVTPDGNGEVDSSVLLTNFRVWYEFNQAGIDRRFAHLISGRNFVGSFIGRAYVGVPCAQSSAYGVDQMDSMDLGRNAALLSHEVGHNWGANHCNGLPGCEIMFSIISSSNTAFGPTSTNSIIGPGAPLHGCITPAVNPGTDCNHNGLCDDEEIAMGLATDNNGTGLPDDCELVHNTTQGIYYKAINTAITDAINGDVIVVAPGIYFEAVDFQNKSISLMSSDGPNVTTIDVEGMDQAGVELTAGTLSGFTVRNSAGLDSFSNAGGGIVVLSGSPLITDCIVRDNMLPVGHFGGGAFFLGSPTVSNSVFCNNSPSHIDGSYTNGGGNSFPATCPVVMTCASALGDVNGDGDIDGADVSSFVECYLTGSTGNGDCLCADVVAGGGVVTSDLQAFVALLLVQ